VGFTYWSVDKAKRVLGYSPRYNFPEFFEALKRGIGHTTPTRTSPGGASSVTGFARPSSTEKTQVCARASGAAISTSVPVGLVGFLVRHVGDEPLAVAGPP
jgi:hypothetical protein